MDDVQQLGDWLEATYYIVPTVWRSVQRMAVLGFQAITGHKKCPTCLLYDHYNYGESCRPVPPVPNDELQIVPRG